MNLKDINLHNKDLFTGVMSILAGVFLLLYTLGIIQAGIDIMFILAAVALIVYGINVSGIYAWLRSIGKG